MPKPRACVYIDGFNLYYGRLKGTKSKWLDISLLASPVLPAYNVERIRYFTASVHPRNTDPTLHVRQKTYLDALGSLANVTVHLGRFLQTTTMMPLYQPQPGSPGFARVIKTEEKGSDVALASHMVADGFLGRYEVAVVISNDSDLVPPIEIVRRELNLVVGVLNPHNNTSHALRLAASFYRPLRAGVVASAQLPDTVQLPDGRLITKPTDWR